MTFHGYLREAITALRLNALRSSLTAIGVIIGVGGIVVMGAAGSGAGKMVEQQIKALGTDALVVGPIKVENAGQRGPVVLLTDEDAKAIAERVPDIQHITREVDGNVTIVAGNASWTPEYWGVDARQNRFLATVALIEALGGGWDAGFLPSAEALEHANPLIPNL